MGPISKYGDLHPMQNHSTASNTTITEWFMRSKQSKKSNGTIKRTPAIFDNKFPPIKLISPPNETKQPKTITPCGDRDHQIHYSNQSQKIN